MALHIKKLWFKCAIKLSILAVYVIPAYDKAEALRHLQRNYEEDDLKQLTWQELKDLTGCIISPGEIPSNFAYGEIMFDCGEVFTILFVND